MNNDPRTDPLLDFLGTPPPQGMLIESAVIAGQVMSFNAATGENTVMVLGTTLTDLPMALTGAEVRYEPGDVVILQRLGNTYLIGYKIVEPFGAGFASASLATVALNAGDISSFPIPTTYAEIIRATGTVPVWANTVSVVAFGNLSVQNNFGADTDQLIKLDINGSVGNPSDFYAPTGHFNAMSVSLSVVQSVTPGTDFYVAIQARANGGFTGNANNFRSISALALFTKS